MKTNTPTVLEMPNNQQAEQGLLGALLVDNSAYEKVCDFLTAEHFYVPANGRIYDAIARLRNKGQSVSAVILKKSFEADGDLEDVGGAEYLADLAASVVTILNVEEYGRSIFDLYQRRRLMEVCGEMMGKASSLEPGTSAADLISETEAALYTVAETVPAANQVKPFSTAIVEAIASADAAFKRDPSAIGISTGLIDLDKLMGGLRSPDLVILAGRPGMGKSALAMGISNHVARLRKSVAFFSLEMSAEQLATRVLAAEARLSSDLIRRGEITSEQRMRFMEAGQRLANHKLYIDESGGQTLAYIRKVGRRIKRQHGLDLCVIDYLQLINTFGKQRPENRVQEITEITKGLKNLAKELGVPVLALSQLSREVEKRDDKRPLISDLRDSGSIEQDADIVAFVYREEYYVQNSEPSCKSDESPDHYQGRFNSWLDRKADCAGKAECIVAKNRHGATGTAHLHFDGPTTTFSNLAALYSVAGVR